MRLAVRFTLNIAASVPAELRGSASLAADGIDDKVDSALRKELLNKLAVELEAKYVVPERPRSLRRWCAPGKRPMPTKTSWRRWVLRKR